MQEHDGVVSLEDKSRPMVREGARRRLIAAALSAHYVQICNCAHQVVMMQRRLTMLKAPKRRLLAI